MRPSTFDVVDLAAEQAPDMALEAMSHLGQIAYGDCRIHLDRTQALRVRDHDASPPRERRNSGVGVRILLDGVWGVAGSTDLTPSGIARAVEAARQMARRMRPLLDDPVVLCPEPAHQATWRGEFKRNPLEVPTQEKVDFLLAATEHALDLGAQFAEFACDQVEETRLFASTDGSWIAQQRVRIDPLFEIGIADDQNGGTVETMRSIALPLGLGWECVEGHPFFTEAEEMVAWLKEKIASPTVRPGAYDLVLDASNLWLTIHETVGHATELDRALGYEANFAGTTFATPDKVGRLQYGSEKMHIVAERETPGGLATVGFDDDGVEAQRWDLVRAGILVGHQLDRHMAYKMGLERSNGCAYSDNWSHFPLQRMPNISLQADQDSDTKVEDLLSGIREGLYIVGDKSMSIDQQRYNFQFTGQRFYRIKNGQIAGQVRDVAYRSTTQEFWARLSGLGGPSTFRLGGSFTCGKGEPGQSAAVSHGCPAALFQGVEVLNTGMGR